MAGEIVEHKGAELDVTASNSSNLLAQIVEASRDPAVDAEKMQAMANLAIQLQDREQMQQFNRDYIAAIMEMPVITKEGRIVIKDKNTGNVIQSTPFERFEDLDRIVKPIARRHNLGYSFEVGGDAQRITVRCVLRHTNGYVYPGEAQPLPLETSGSKNNVQGAGSSQTYGKRYALKAAFAISTEGGDDDGNLGQTTVSLPHEREVLVLGEAEAAHEAGNYAEYFKGQSPKDRAFLVKSGKHAEYGGPALPAPKPVETREKIQEEASAKTYETREKVEENVDEQRAKWVANYCQTARQCRDQAQLEELKAKHQDKLFAIRDNYNDLWRDISSAHASVGRPEGGGSLFEEG